MTGGGKDKSGMNIFPHFTDDYADIKLKEAMDLSGNIAEPSLILKTQEKYYAYAERYSRDHGFRIYNATRGGELEVFERVDFDGLFR
jgi:hypothetical protein